MAKLHDLLKSHGYDGHELRVYLVRLLFCLFAHDTGIFPQDSLYEYIEKSKPDGSDLSDRINKLFEILDMPPDVREKRTLISDELKQFRHINGKLFMEHLPSAEFNATMRQMLIECLGFDWSKISPAIFGAMFQGVMDEKRRRELGAHYTSEENILKLIDPLFLDELWHEFDRVKTSPAALDYVSAWYKKAAQMICGTSIRAAFVSTNSISQGEQPAVLWKSLVDTVKIDFAYRTFKWNNDAKGKAAVHCVIIGFSHHNTRNKHVIYEKENKLSVTNINPYLVDAPNVLIESRSLQPTFHAAGAAKSSSEP